MDVAAVLAHQLEMTGTTWSLLQLNGIGEGDRRSVDFFFYPPDEQRARAPAAALQDQGGCPTVEGIKVGLLRKKTEWAVIGQSPPLIMSEPSLRAWVTQMVELGAVHDTEFDGWGTEA